MSTEEAQNILNKMVASVRESKDKAGAGLTPVSGERTFVAPVSTPEAPFAGLRDAAFPYDGPEFVVPAIRRALGEIDFIRLGLVALLNAYGAADEAVVVDEAAVVKAKEAAADARVAAKASPEAIAEMLVEIAPGMPPLRSDLGAVLLAAIEDGEDDDDAIGWQCPDHDSRAVRKTSPLGREYIGCSIEGCKKFERLK